MPRSKTSLRTPWGARPTGVVKVGRMMLASGVEAVADVEAPLARLSSVSPTPASSGSVKIAVGTSSYSASRDGPANMSSTAIRAW